MSRQPLRGASLDLAVSLARTTSNALAPRSTRGTSDSTPRSRTGSRPRCVLAKAGQHPAAPRQGHRPRGGSRLPTAPPSSIADLEHRADLAAPAPRGPLRRRTPRPTTASRGLAAFGLAVGHHGHPRARRRPPPRRSAQLFDRRRRGVLATTPTLPRENRTKLLVEGTALPQAPGPAARPPSDERGEKTFGVFTDRSASAWRPSAPRSSSPTSSR